MAVEQLFVEINLLKVASAHQTPRRASVVLRIDVVVDGKVKTELEDTVAASACVIGLSARVRGITHRLSTPLRRRVRIRAESSFDAVSATGDAITFSGLHRHYSKSRGGGWVTKETR